MLRVQANVSIYKLHQNRFDFLFGYIFIQSATPQNRTLVVKQQNENRLSPR